MYTARPNGLQRSRPDRAACPGRTLSRPQARLALPASPGVRSCPNLRLKSRRICCPNGIGTMRQELQQGKAPKESKSIAAYFCASVYLREGKEMKKLLSTLLICLMSCALTASLAAPALALVFTPHGEGAQRNCLSTVSSLETSPSERARSCPTRWWTHSSRRMWRPDLCRQAERYNNWANRRCKREAAFSSSP